MLDKHSVAVQTLVSGKTASVENNNYIFIIKLE